MKIQICSQPLPESRTSVVRRVANEFPHIFVSVFPVFVSFRRSPPAQHFLVLFIIIVHIPPP